MTNNHNEEQEQDQDRLSRTQYRQQQRATKRLREEEQVSVEPLDDNLTGNESDGPSFRRETTANERHEQLVAAKTARLKKRLNIAIVILVVAIIIVYLILFYVG